MKKILTAFLLLGVGLVGHAQKKYQPTIIPCDCNFKIDSSFVALMPPTIKINPVFTNLPDSSFKTDCGYLIVPENRSKASSKMIRLPFIIVRSKNPDKKKDPVLFTSGGPGNSSLGWAQGISRSAIINDRDCIAFEQRGTRFAIPHTRNFILDNAMREAYRKNLNKDSMTLVALKKYKKELIGRGIDMDGYNSDETVNDIHDLINILKIDSVNLHGGSYSGGLMLAVLKQDPSKIRTLTLDSPLPMFSPIDEDEPVNFHEALHILCERIKTDSTDQVKYGNLENQFREYFLSIMNKKFYFRYLEKGTTDSIRVEYTKVELLDAIVNAMLNSRMKDVPFLIHDIISGNHAPYIQKKLDDIFNRNIAPDGMRIAVYCADQANYHSEQVIKELYQLYPYMEGYHINDVYKAMCDCWQQKPLKATTKLPYYSFKPAFIADGELDAACRPLYIKEIKHYMPNAQTFLFTDRGHGVGGKVFNDMWVQFLNNPFVPLPESTNVRRY